MKSKKDTIHDDIVLAVRQLGVSVFETYRLGRFYDTVWGIGWMTLIVEIKTGKAKLKDTQVEDAGRWFHHGKIVVVRSVDQAIALACWMKEMSNVIHMDAWSQRCPAEILKAA